MKATHNISNFLTNILSGTNKEKEVDKCMWYKYLGSRHRGIYGCKYMGAILYINKHKYMCIFIYMNKYKYI